MAELTVGVIDAMLAICGTVSGSVVGLPVTYARAALELARAHLPGETLAEVHIPGFLPRGSQNAREHHMVAARRIKREHLLIGSALLAGAKSLRNRGALVGRVVMTRNTSRLADSDNCVASMKGTRDSIAKFLGIDDGANGIAWAVEQKKVPRAGVGVVIRIEGRR